MTVGPPIGLLRLWKHSHEDIRSGRQPCSPKDREEPPACAEQLLRPGSAPGAVAEHRLHSEQQPVTADFFGLLTLAQVTWGVGVWSDKGRGPSWGLTGSFNKYSVRVYNGTGTLLGAVATSENKIKKKGHLPSDGRHLKQGDQAGLQQRSALGPA